jgi:TonB family protein
MTTTLIALAALVLAAAPARAQEGAAPPAPETSDAAVVDRARVLRLPAYPDGALGQGVAGTVAVRVLVGPDGEVISARAVDGPEPLRAAAAEAVRSWEFASTDSPDKLAGYLLFRFAPGERYASVLGVEEAELAVAPEREPPPPSPPAPTPAAAPAPAPGPQRVSAAALLGRATRKVPPRYPSSARASRIEGTVLVEVEVDESGRVAAARPLSGHALLREAAVAAALQWTVALPAGAPAKVIGTISFNFKL